LVTTWLNQAVDHVAVLIHGPPQIVLLAIDPNESFVQVPAVAQATLTPLQTSSVAGTELLTPNSNRFIGEDDPAFGEKIFDIPDAQAETMANPDRVADDFGRKPMAVIARPPNFIALVLFSSRPNLTMPERRLPLFRRRRTDHPRL
jgi:hypothetical protein